MTENREMDQKIKDCRAAIEAYDEFTDADGIMRIVLEHFAPQQPAELRRKCGTLLMVRVPPQPYEKPMGECWLDAGHEGEHDFNPPMQSTVTVSGQNFEPAKDEERKR